MAWIRAGQAIFAGLITLQFAVVVLHDWLDIRGWTHGKQVQAVVGQRKLWIATLVNAIFPGLAVAFAFYFWNRPKPGFVTNYWVAYCAVTLLSAIVMCTSRIFWALPKRRAWNINECTPELAMFLPRAVVIPGPISFTFAFMYYSWSTSA